MWCIAMLNTAPWYWAVMFFATQLNKTVNSGYMAWFFVSWIGRLSTFPIEEKTFSKHRPSGPMLSISRFVRLSVCPSVRVSVCPSVRVSVCSLLRYRLTVFLPSLPEVGCPIFLEIRNPWGKDMNIFVWKLVKIAAQKKVFFFTFFGLLWFSVFFNGLFAPTSCSRMSNIFRDSESLGKSNGKKWSQIWTFLFENCVKSPRRKKFFS